MTEPTAAPYRSEVMQVEDAWIDYNGHLNMAYYNVLFDRAVDQAFIDFGLGPDYVSERHASYFTVETHLCYLAELNRGDPVRVETRIMDFDDKRLHIYQELYHADGWLSATSEQIHLHVDMDAKRAAPWPDDIRARIEAAFAVHSQLERPERSGRSIGIVRKSA
ncbi:MAG: thioesterase [Hyphomicrobiales bacterium]|nr:MAG: thioesterase [Hyphomicrobiales bacterium]